MNISGTFKAPRQAWNGSRTKNVSKRTLMYSSERGEMWFSCRPPKIAATLSFNTEALTWVMVNGIATGGSTPCVGKTEASKLAIRKILSSASSWPVLGNPIRYCLNEKVDSTCSVNFRLKIMYVVLAFNSLKLAMMIWIMLRYDAEKILTSVGDAAASFLAWRI